MVYRFSSSLFALLLCMEIGTPSSLQAMQVCFEEEEGIIPQQLSHQEKQELIEEVKQKLYHSQSIEERQNAYKTLCSFSPNNFGDIELEYSRILFKNEELRDGLNFFALSIAHEKTKKAFYQEFHDNFVKFLEKEDSNILNDYHTALQKSRERKLGECMEKTLNVMNFIKNKLSTESYEYFFRYACQTLIGQEGGDPKKNQKNITNFVKHVYIRNKPAGIYVPYVYLYRSLLQDVDTSNEEKYKLYQTIVTDPLFIENSPPTSWITTERDEILSGFVCYGIKEKKFEIIESYCKNNVKNSTERYFKLNRIYHESDQYDKLLELIKERNKDTISKEEKKANLFEEIFVLQKLKRDEEVKRICNQQKKKLRALLRINKITEESKIMILQLLGEEEEAQRILKEKQQRFMRAFSHHAPKNIQNPPQKNIPEKKETLSILQPTQVPMKQVLPSNELSKENNLTLPINSTNNQLNVPKTLPKKIGENNPIQYSSTNNSALESRKNKEEIERLQKQEKVKTKGIVDQTLADKKTTTYSSKKTTPQQEKKEETKKTNLFKILKSKPGKVLTELFRPFTEKNVTFFTLNISYHDIQTLFNAVPEMNLTHHTGGSHLKLNAKKEKKIDNDMNEIMNTIKKKTYLHPAALEDIVRTFISYGIYPEDVKEDVLEWIKK